MSSATLSGREVLGKAAEGVGNAFREKTACICVGFGPWQGIKTGVSDEV